MAFSDAVRHELCIEADGWCSAPDCRVRTGYFVKSESIAAGDGAHIVAESDSGPRGNSPLTPEQRSFAQNGLWLCPTCHRQIHYGQDGEGRNSLLFGYLSSIELTAATEAPVRA